jgi:predicted TPR repeat methyltransferase
MPLLDQELPTGVGIDYTALAPYYDAFTEHPGYAGWVRSLETLARRHGLSGRRALDLGCGTGSSLLPLIELGYDATGCDLSAAMLEHAARKLPPTVELVEADMRALPELGSFDLVWSLNDTVNYLAEADDLRLAFAQVSARLAPGGVFVFDANTLATYATFFAGTHARQTPTLMMTWVGSGDARPRSGASLEARLEVFELEDGGLWRRSTSRHRQRHHPQAMVRAALAAAGLRLVAVHGLTADAEIEEDFDERRHTKAIHVATHDERERR